ncbi:ABC-2 type transport system permease protein [Haladaptatus litoreus]|uniref:ABC-2 type transport system permease protein n=1 Tax=Haladaptatus litoreus TaxID=553468 RepID=A0A1N6VQY0_9EURY|nr:ABC transporter permease [Haladaptatus litoreus]SIQ80227.1 ABC-2 type transport system permease protein [Haladaptatus litoreus]
MSWAVVARKDFQDARLSKTLWALSALFVLFAAGMAYIYAELPALGGEAGELSALGLMFFLAAPATLFVSITAVVVAAKSLAGERESGSMKLLLSYPHTRRDVVLGKVAGRAAVLALPIIVGFAVAAIVVLAKYATFTPVDYVVFVLLTVLYAFAYISLVVGLSATTGSGARATAMAIGLFVVLELLWDVVPLGALYLLEGRLVPIQEYPNWALFLSGLTPSAAYTTAMGAVLPESPNAVLGIGSGDVPFYLADWFGLVLLVAWAVVPVSLGYLRFRGADL